LKKALGLKIVLRKAGWAVHYDSISSGDYDLGFMGWFTNVLDGVFILENFKNKHDSSNKCRWENA
jgi:ABC-type oligopeptide transport system substrate-binding subunit